MNPARIWTLGAVVAIIAIFGAAGALGVQPHLAAAAAADQSAQATVAQNGATTVEIARLTRVAATQSALAAKDEDLEWAVPPNMRMNSFSKMMREAAALDGVSIEAFTPSSPTLYAPAASSVTPVAPAPAGGAATPTTAPTAAAVDPKSPWFGKTDPAITPANFTVVPMTITVKGPAAGVVAFASDAQKQRRLFALTTVSTQYDEETGVTTGVISGSVYMLDQ